MTPPDAVAARPREGLAPPAQPAAESRAQTLAHAVRAAKTRLSKYLAIFRVSLKDRMTYRGDFLIGTILRFLPMITTILLWHAIYAGSQEKQLGSDRMHFSYREMIAYLLLTNISRMFSSMPGLAGGIAREIREGTTKRYMIQPIDMIGSLFLYRVAHKITYIIMSFLPYALLFFLCRSYFDGFPDALTLAAFAVSLVLSFLVGFFFEASVGMVGFWFLEVTSLLYIVMTLNFFISGHMLPLDLLPEPWVTLLKLCRFTTWRIFRRSCFWARSRG